MKLRLGFLVLLCGAATAFMGVRIVESVDAAQLFNSQTQSSEKNEEPTLYNKQNKSPSGDSPTLYNKQEGYVPSKKGKSGLIVKKKHAGDDGGSDYETASLFQTIVKRTPVTSQLEHLLSPGALQNKKADVDLAIDNEFKRNIQTAKMQQEAHLKFAELSAAAYEKDRLAREAYFAELEQDKIERREKRLHRLNMDGNKDGLSNVVKRKKKKEEKTRQTGTPLYNQRD